MDLNRLILPFYRIAGYPSIESYAMEAIMVAREAIRILMLSPIYFTLPLRNRVELIKEYCQLFDRLPKIKK
jgi:hypothetical protein